ncbi:GntR family transcriptional regulator / MocR family aminotransferase [Leifsonia sp. 98AMF]|uniref:MocR-like pyridoxine biosynthesis transcription factor PdxR n=1 Tax=unclassified Leifsonia TaxID=2663824 RepID=UPI0008797464|nr:MULTISPECIES: PLP-dependent aminotransferase family protein [unclassified Leifsonia]SDH51252.1 GntR family transcriptional regulator / MocR family aminotransferase [Leifsonia sp. 197AMF]SDI86896.1 GntR family transcriptional regulator / MocR family aminotransferase [Leifsonia sp. 466MF]SDJ95014.1 GntR family transcriptional regulator / MocR family aminotransferase [Leifsonia sp. 157MF]SDN90317.1 GntR family transcriptional regulator / MocR family aminotransferase [Leifsonia sp. 509MF]SEN156
MAVEWSNSSPELLVQLDRESAEPLRSQLQTQLRVAIQAGRLSAGERLPSSRDFARSLGVARGTVQDCYEQLRSEGYLVAQTGSATRVADLRVEPAEATAPGAPIPTPDPHPPRRWLADFASGVPDLGTVPRDDWTWALREATRTAPNAAFDYGDPRGDADLRTVVASYLRRVRGMSAHPHQVVVCAGFAQGIALTFRALADRGMTRVAVEDPGSIGTVTRAAEAAGGTAVPVAVDDSGIDVDALDASGARIVVLTPAHQWPTGVVLAPERRHALIAWAERRDAVIVEDDYDAEFRYDREPVGSLQGLAPDRVVTLGTVSKSLAPALRLGWAVAPVPLVDALTAAKEAADRGAPTLDQVALARLIESGRYDRHLRRMRALYGARRDALAAALREAAPHIPLTGLAAGFHAVAHLRDGADEPAVIAAAAERGVRLYGMSTYRSTRSSHPPQLVFGFGNTSVEEIRDGIAVVADLLR